MGRPFVDLEVQIGEWYSVVSGQGHCSREPDPPAPVPWDPTHRYCRCDRPANASSSITEKELEVKRLERVREAFYRVPTPLPRTLPPGPHP